MSEAGTVLVAAPFDAQALAGFQGALGPGYALEVATRIDQAGLDAALHPGVVGLVAQLRPSDPARPDRLRWQQVLSAGVDHVLAVAPWHPGIVLTNARGVHAVGIGQYVLAAILRIAERMDARQELQAAGRWPSDETPYLATSVRGRTLVVVGYGSIGREIGRLGAAFGMRVLAVATRPGRRADDALRRIPGTGDPDARIPERIVGVDGLADALAEADFVAVTLPLTPRTHGLLDARAIGALGSQAWIVNTGRGAVLDETALIGALRAGRVGGAVLDVFEVEPLPGISLLWSLPNVVLTPHVAGTESPGAVAELVEANIQRFTRGLPLINVVDAGRGY